MTKQAVDTPLWVKIGRSYIPVRVVGPVDASKGWVVEGRRDGALYLTDKLYNDWEVPTRHED